MSYKEHLNDIDFRSREVRSENAIQGFKEWYEELIERQQTNPSERIQGQITMLSSVLWYLLPKAEYKKLVTH